MIPRWAGTARTLVNSKQLNLAGIKLKGAKRHGKINNAAIAAQQVAICLSYLHLFLKNFF